MKIQIVGFDPAFANWGAVHAEYNTMTDEIAVLDMSLQQTKKDNSKGLYKKVDDFNRAKQLAEFARDFAMRGSVVFSEMPIGSQSASAAWGLGAAIGVLAGVGLTKPINFVTVDQVKEVVGSNRTTKREMIEWASEKYPDADWLRVKRKGAMVLTDKNEHLADAIAVIHAGVRTDQFKQLANLFAGLKITQR